MIYKLVMNIKQFAWFVTRKLGFGPWILRFYPKSYLKNVGWFKSFHDWRPEDDRGLPIPWLTYPFIHFIEPRLNKGMRVFEFGSGYSTSWYANRVQEIISIEHDVNWAKKVNEMLPPNGKVITSTGVEDYINEINLHGKFEIIVIDGIFREECWQNALNALAEDGVIIWDNSERTIYKQSISTIIDIGFREIEFFGMTPTEFVSSQTSILYRNNNCLGI